MEHHGLALASGRAWISRGQGGAQAYPDLRRAVEALVRIWAGKGSGRGHVTLWCHDIAGAVHELLRSGHLPGAWPRLRLALGNKGLTSATLGRIHMRGLSSWVDLGPSDLAEWANPPGPEGEASDLACWAHAMEEAMVLLGAAGLSGSGTRAIHELWRSVWSPVSAWRWPLGTDTADWAREGLYGGYVQSWLPGAVYPEGHAPRRLIGKYRMPCTTLPSSHRMWRVDMNSAYQTVMRLPMPWVWGDGMRRVGSLPGRNLGTQGATAAASDLDLDAWGVAEVDLQPPPAGIPIVPFRRRIRGRYETLWIDRGNDPLAPRVARGVWPITLIREAVIHGALIHKVHYALQTREESLSLRDLVESLHAAAQGCAVAPVAKAIKGLGRRIYGRFAAGRMRWDVGTHAEACAALHVPGLGLCAVAGDVVILGPDLCGWRVQSEEYPSAANPIWAAEITARTHVSLTRSARAVQALGCVPVYADTDSLLFSGEPTEDGAPLPGRVRLGTALGEYKIDWTGTWGVFFGPKTYVLSGNRTAIAGCPRDLQAALAAHGRVEHWRPASGWEVLTGVAEAGELRQDTIRLMPAGGSRARIRRGEHHAAYMARVADDGAACVKPRSYTWRVDTRSGAVLARERL